MSTRRALIVAVALGTLSLSWAASRYSRHMGAATDDSGASGEKVTLKFFRNPASAPTFQARDLDGRDVSLAALRGKVIIVNFWATWCPPCRAEIPELIALQEKYRDQLQVIGVLTQDEASPDTVRRFVADHHINYPIVMPSPELEGKFPGMAALPTSFIVDRQSRLVQKHVGMLTASLTEQETRALAGLTVNVEIEEVDQTQGLKLDNAQLITIPGVDLSTLSPAKRTEALQKLNGQGCTCGCDLTVARCRVDDPTCGVSLPLARQIVQRIVDER